MIGRRLLHYEIVEKLGEGGMGVVYKARDTHLDRFVAIKVLPPEKVSDPSRKARFVQEAKAASALNHPNIITIYDISSDGGVDFIAMEYVAGKTLDQLVRRKGLKLNDVLRYAIQIAGALAKAHAAGIVHRDLKPSNVMVTADGLVKVLDFGLAKLTEQATSEDDSTATIGVRTDEGTIAGTAAYMSPEQAEGRPVDARSDIFSIGSLLYEMVTGQRAFVGDSKMSTLSAVLHKEPLGLPKDVPREVERIVLRCLRKDPERRFQDAKDLKVELEELREESDSGTLAGIPPETPGSGRRRLVIVGLAVISTGAITAGLVWKLRPRTQTAPPYRFTQLTDPPGNKAFPSLAPDGKSFAFASDAAGRWDIYVQRVGGRTAMNLTRDSGSDNTQPAFSPEGERIAFRSDRDGGGIFVMGATGESVKRLTDSGFNPVWSPNGSEVLFASEGITFPGGRSSKSQLWAVDATTGDRRSVFEGDAVQPQWSPHGHRIAYWSLRSGARDIYTIPASGGKAAQRTAVTNDAATDWNPVWSPDGKHLYFASDRGGSMNLWRVAIDEVSGKVLGKPEAVTTPAPYIGHLSFSSDGRRVAYRQTVSVGTLESLGFDPATEQIAAQRSVIFKSSLMPYNLDLSPDGKSLAFMSSRPPQEDLYVVGVDGTGLRQLTDDPYQDRLPRWSPDGKRIVFYSTRSGDYQIYTMGADGSGLQQLTEGTPGNRYPVWSPDGTRLAIYGNLEHSRIIEVRKPWKEQSPRRLPPEIFAWAWSRDGRRIAGGHTQPIRWQPGIGVYDFDLGSVRWLTESGYVSAWLSDSRRLLCHDGPALRVLDSQTGKTREIVSVAPHEIAGNAAISRDDRKIYFSVSASESEIWLMSLEGESR